MFSFNILSEPVVVVIKGIDDGKKTSKQQDYKEAVINAKLQAIERAGVEVQSITKMENFQLKSEIVESKAKALIMPDFQIIDIGYQTDGTYQVVFSGKVNPTRDPNSNTEGEKELWEFAKELNNEEGYSLYLNEYPNGVFAKIAKYKIKLINEGGKTNIEIKPEKTKNNDKKYVLKIKLKHDGSFKGKELIEIHFSIYKDDEYLVGYTYDFVAHDDIDDIVYNEALPKGTYTVWARSTYSRYKPAIPGGRRHFEKGESSEDKFSLYSDKIVVIESEINCGFISSCEYIAKVSQ